MKTTQEFEEVEYDSSDSESDNSKSSESESEESKKSESESESESSKSKSESESESEKESKKSDKSESEKEDKKSESESESESEKEDKKSEKSESEKEDKKSEKSEKSESESESESEKEDKKSEKSESEKEDKKSEKSDKSESESESESEKEDKKSNKSESESEKEDKKSDKSESESESEKESKKSDKSDKSESESESESDKSDKSESESESDKSDKSESESGSDTQSESGSESASSDESEAINITRTPTTGEIVSNEKTYVDQLSDLIEKYITKIKNSKASDLVKGSKNQFKILTPEELEFCYGNIEAIEKLHKKLYEKLIHSEDAKFPDIFLSSDFESLYSKFIKNFPDTLRNYGKMRKHNDDFFAFNHEAARYAKYPDPLLYLILPFKRVKNLIKSFEGLPENEKRNEFLKKLELLLQMQDENCLNILKVAEINDRFKNLSEPLVDSARKYIFEGNLNQMTQTGPQDRIGILFSDIFVFGTQVSSNIQYKGSIDLTYCKVIALNDSQTNFRLEDSEQTVEFSTSNAAERNMWVLKLKEAINSIKRISQAGFTVKKRNDKYVILDTGLTDESILSLITNKSSKIVVINCSGKGKKKWRDGVDVIKGDLTDIALISRVCHGARAIYGILAPPFDQYPEFILNATHECLKYPNPNYSVSFGKVKNEGDVMEVIILDRRRTF